MKKPVLKKLLSYFTDVLLESSSSEYNKVLEVYLSRGRYQLCTSGAIYSFEDKYINFLETFRAINWDKLRVEKVLLLGLGMASIPQMLEKKFKMDFEYHAVEIDSEIIDMAGKYILDELNSPIYIYEMDAEIFVDISEEKFELIVVDIFDNNLVPWKFESSEFIGKVKNLLSPDGFVLFNRLNTDDKTYEETERYYKNVISNVFPDSKKIFIKNNIVLSSRDAIFI